MMPVHDIPEFCFTVQTVWTFSQDEYAKNFKTVFEKIGSQAGVTIKLNTYQQANYLKAELSVCYSHNIQSFEIHGSSYEACEKARQSMSRYLSSQIIRTNETPFSSARAAPTHAGLPSSLILLNEPETIIDITPSPSVEEDRVPPSRHWKQFFFSSDVRDPSDIVNERINPTTTVLQDICRDTNVRGEYDGQKTVSLEGQSKEAVDEVYRRLELLQSLYLRPRYIPVIVPLLHYQISPTENINFKLHFQHLSSYIHFPSISLGPELSHTSDQLYVVVPTLRNKRTGEYERPPERPRQPPSSLPSSTPSDSDFPPLPQKVAKSPMDSGAQKSWSAVVNTRNQANKRLVGNQEKNQGNPALIKDIRNYNQEQIRTALTAGLEEVRSHKGEVKLSARLGKVFWMNVNDNVRKNLWEYTDLKSIYERIGVKPIFSSVTTASENKMLEIVNMFPENSGRSQFFEIKAFARNQPREEYKPVVMYVSQGYVEIQKVVTKRKKIVDIDWCSLNRKYDFQWSLSTTRFEKKDVKPFSTFMKKCSVSPKSKQITYQNINDFLNVKSIQYWSTYKFKLHGGPFILQISKVEDLPLKDMEAVDGGSFRVIGVPGKGTVWFEVELLNSDHEKYFSANSTLATGTLAPWTVDDILGEGSDTVKLVEYVKTLLQLLDQFESFD